jgi:hypothetical protein
MTLGTMASVIAGATKRSNDASLCLDSWEITLRY